MNVDPNQAQVLFAQGRVAEARLAMARLVHDHPEDLNLWLLAGQIAEAAGAFGLAASVWRHLLVFIPDHDQLEAACALAWLNHGAALRALRHLAAAAKLSPLDVGHACNLANALDELGRSGEAVAKLVLAAALAPGEARVWVNLAALRPSSVPAAAAVTWGQRGKLASPSFAEAHYNLGVALYNAERDGAAIQSFRAALALDATPARYHFNLAHALLRAGHWHEGFGELRWRQTMVPPITNVRRFAQPEWTDPRQAGEHLLVHAEQGYGDTFHFARYVPLAQRSFERVTFLVQPGLGPLISRWLGISCIEEGEALPAFSHHIPIMTLPWLLELGDHVPHPPPLSPRGDRLGMLSGHVTSAPGIKRIGLTTSGKPSHRNDHNRSIPLQAFAPLAARHDVEFHLIQLDLRDDDQRTWREGFRLIRHDAAIGDFEDTLALISLMDLVISVDTAIAHLAASSGVTTWILVPENCDYRWGLGSEGSALYPTARLWRRQAEHTWSEVIDRIGAALDAGT